MVSSQVVAVLLAAVLVQVTTFPLEADTPDKATCQAFMFKAIHVLRDLTAEWEALRQIKVRVQQELKACKYNANPQEESTCEMELKFAMGFQALMVLKGEYTGKIEAGKSALANVASCRVKSHPFLGVQPRDLNTCFATLDESRGLLAELYTLMDKTKMEIEFSFADKVEKCKKAGLGDKCNVLPVVQMYDELLAVVNSILQWKDAGQDNLQRLDQCMYV